MSKAKERANEAFPLLKEGDVQVLNSFQYAGIFCDTIEEYNSIQLDKQAFFIAGYKQAEKDLELTWEDIPKIFQIAEELKISWWFRDNEQTKQIGTQVFGEEVLKRFKDFKERKEKCQ